MSIIRRMGNLFSRSKVDREIHQELVAHIEMRVEDNIAAGMPAREARRDALVRFGNPVVVRERTLHADVALYLESFWNSRFGYGATVSVAILVLSIAVAALLLGKLFKGAFDV